ncbi:MAG TPA: septum formation initiator family protein [Candidatus Paceibacterota bacterium]|nr:septum formation initiator family protein [Candidatus Paceibacterota bacterium]
MLRFVLVGILGILLILLVSQIWYFYERGKTDAKAYAELQQELTAAQAENASLKADLEYYQHPENLEKELRARFNYKAKGETMLVLVPPAGSTSTPTTTKP